jgi:hypothetical protein
MPSGFDEDQTRFTGALALGEFFASYGYCCAFTGEDLRAAIESEALSALLRLTPQTELRADLVIPACEDARTAYTEGSMLVGPDYSLILNPRPMSDPGLIERVNPTFRLRLPDNPDFAPNQLVLREHRLSFLG